MGLRFTKGNENGVPQVSPFLRDLVIGLPAGARLPTSRKRGVMWGTPDFLAIAGRRGPTRQAADARWACTSGV